MRSPGKITWDGVAVPSSPSMSAEHPIDTREKITLVVSAAIVLVAVVYWVMQILDVMDTLKLAYGG